MYSFSVCTPRFLQQWSDHILLMIMLSFRESGSIECTGHKPCLWLISKQNDLGYILLKVKCILRCLFFFQLSVLTSIPTVMLCFEQNPPGIRCCLFNACFIFIQAKKNKSFISNSQDHYYKVLEEQRMSAVGSGAACLQSIMVRNIPLSAHHSTQCSLCRHSLSLATLAIAKQLSRCPSPTWFRWTDVYLKARVTHASHLHCVRSYLRTTEIKAQHFLLAWPICVTVRPVTVFELEAVAQLYNVKL